MTGMEPTEQHLRGSNHKEAAARYAIGHRDTAPHLLLSLSSLTRKAVTSGVIQQTHLGSTKCTVCDITLTGTRQIEDHLAGDAHKKKCQCQSFGLPAKPIQPQALPIQFQAMSIQPQAMPIQPQAMPFQAHATPIQNQALPIQPQAMSIQHQAMPIQHQAMSIQHQAMSIQHQAMPIQHQAMSIQPIPSGIPHPGGATALPLAGGDDVEVEQLAQQAIDAGHVRQTDDVMSPYICITCHKNFNGKQTLYQHLKSNTHRKKVNSTTTAMDPGRSLVQMTSHDPYSVRSSPRGVVHVFNYKFDGQGKKWEREGAEHDSTNLRGIFTLMGYEVKVHENLSNEDTREMMKSIRNGKRLKDVDALIFFFLSHGKDPYTFYTNDKIEMNLFNIRYMFTDRRCPAMSSKPKIFFMNYCRGEGQELERREVDTSSHDTPNDMVTVHAAAEGIMAYRTSARGTHFVEYLCQVLRSYSRSHELREIYNMVRDEMSARNSTRPMWEDYGFKKFYFNPV
ncbi:hypothetical protein Pcinc_040380 [Petrolisthes cinctipes]|uniref:C2H2-type domain-containing protein n=1 Tax=Petrolisthes cinctipes TaxID=88211 RepID=A0AAE1EI28_PETCI|nr:hypothetical protein Pcinc_040380 [Petrolisthes cinctipes]